MSILKGGDKLDKYLAKVATRVKNAGALHVGFLEGSTYPDGTSVPLVAAVQNFGSAAAGVPPRPFFSDMIRTKGDSWVPALGEVLKASDYDAQKALAMMGEGIKGQLQEAITTFSGTPLSPETIAHKGHDKQLVETGHMLNSVDYEVTSAS